MAFHTSCFTVTPSAGTPPYNLDFSGVSIEVSVPPTGNVIDLAAYLSGAGAPTPYTAAYGASSDNLTTDLAAGQIISSSGPVTLTADANVLAYAGQTGYIGFSGAVVVTDSGGCVQTIDVPEGYLCPFEAVYQNTAPNCPSIPDIQCTGGDVIDFTSPVFTDADGDTVALTFAGAPAWLTMIDNGNGTFDADGTSPTGASSVTVSVTASDGTDTCLATLTITCASGVNTAPTAPPNVTTDCDVDFPYTSAAFTDADGDPLVLSQSGLDVGYSFTDNGNGTYTIAVIGTPAPSTFTVTATDPSNATATQTHTIDCLGDSVTVGGDCGNDGGVPEPLDYCGYGNVPTGNGAFIGSSATGDLCGSSLTRLVINTGPVFTLYFDVFPALPSGVTALTVSNGTLTETIPVTGGSSSYAISIPAAQGGFINTILGGAFSASVDCP